MKILNENANIPNIENIKALDEKIRQVSEISVYKSYAGFPVLKGGQFADKFIIEYALLTHKALYICNFCEDSLEDVCEYQDNIYNLVESSLKKTPTMVVKRNLICEIFTITISKNNRIDNNENYIICNSIEDFISFIKKNELTRISLEESTLRKINAALLFQNSKKFYPVFLPKTILRILSLSQGLFCPKRKEGLCFI